MRTQRQIHSGNLTTTLDHTNASIWRTEPLNQTRQLKDMELWNLLFLQNPKLYKKTANKIFNFLESQNKT